MEIEGETPELAKAWFKMIELRYKKHTFKLKIEDHPKYFQSLITISARSVWV